MDARAARRSRRQLPEGRNNRRRWSGAGFPRSVRIPGTAVRSETCRYSLSCLPVELANQRIAEDEPGKSGPKSKGLFFQEKEKRLSESKYSAHAESHVPCFQERVGTKHPGYMIPDRLPWRHRARPSATLHEIQVRSEERTCSCDATKSNRRRQAENRLADFGSDPSRGAATDVSPGRKSGVSQPKK